MMMVLVMHTEDDDTELHIKKTGMWMLVVEINGGMTADVVDKLTCSSDVVQPRQLRTCFILEGEYSETLCLPEIVRDSYCTCSCHSGAMKISGQNGGEGSPPTSMERGEEPFFHSRSGPEERTVLNRFENHPAMLSV
nr:hypothetical protein [Tanacetum cinerariifolium]